MPGSKVESTYLVEHYRPGLGAAQLGDCVADLRNQVRAQPVQAPVATCSPPQLLCSVIVPTDEAFLVMFRADSEHQVQELYQRTGTTFDRISVAIADLSPALRSGPGPAHDP
jgi:hypothetical protein